MASILIKHVGIHLFIHSVPLKITCPVHQEQWWWSTFHLFDIKSFAFQALLSTLLWGTCCLSLPGAQATFGTAVIQLLSHLAVLPFAVYTHLQPGLPATVVIEAIPGELKAQHNPMQLAENLTTKFSTWWCDETMHFMIILAILLMLWTNILFWTSTRVYAQ